MVRCARVDEKKYSRYFKAFGDQSRLKILEILSEGEKTVNEIVAAMEISQPTVSRHLGVLRNAGIVADRREGQRIYYRLDKAVIFKCCKGLCDCLAVVIRPTKKEKRKR